jgi:hypothetical protein
METALDSLLEPLQDSEWLEVRETQGATSKQGRAQLGVIAKRPLRQGTLVLRQRALAWQPLGTRQLCSYCLQEDPELRKCTRCGSLYCDPVCQQAHWPVHKRYCAQVPVPSASALLLQCLASEREVDVDEDGELPALLPNLQSFKALLWNQVSADDIKAAMRCAAPSGQETSALAELIARFRSNNFAISGPLLVPLADAVFPFAAMLNHSCAPNVVPRYECEQGSAPVMSFITLCDIKAGEELLHSYVDLCQGPRARAAQLKRNYGFACKCTRCLNPFPIDDALEAEDPGELPKALQAIGKDDAQLEWAQLALLSKQAKRIINPQHQVVRSLLQRQMQNALVRSDWRAAIHIGERLLAIDEQCAPPTHPSLLVQRGLINELKSQ